MRTTSLALLVILITQSYAQSNGHNPATPRSCHFDKTPCVPGIGQFCPYHPPTCLSNEFCDEGACRQKKPTARPETTTVPAVTPTATETLPETPVGVPSEISTEVPTQAPTDLPTEVPIEAIPTQIPVTPTQTSAQTPTKAPIAQVTEQVGCPCDVNQVRCPGRQICLATNRLCNPLQEHCTGSCIPGPNRPMLPQIPPTQTIYIRCKNTALPSPPPPPPAFTPEPLQPEYILTRCPCDPITMRCPQDQVCSNSGLCVQSSGLYIPFLSEISKPRPDIGCEGTSPSNQQCYEGEVCVENGRTVDAADCLGVCVKPYAGSVF